MNPRTDYDHALKVQLETTVDQVKKDNEGYWHSFAQTIFYPESGGMMADEGTINNLEVLKLKKEDGIVWHLLKEELKGTVSMQVNYKIRLNHIQAHSTQHLVSALFIKDYRIQTKSHHYLSDGNCDLDLDTNELSKEQLDRIEKEANEIILEDLPYNISYLTKEEAEKYTDDFSDYEDLTKFRLVSIPHIDNNLCGCPHVPSSRYLRGINLLSWSKIAGGVKLIISCGDHLINKAHEQFDLLNETSTLLSSTFNEIPNAINKLKDNLVSSEKKYTALHSKYLESLSDSKIAKLSKDTLNYINETHTDLSGKDLSFLVSRYCAQEKVIVTEVALSQDNSCTILIGTSKDITNISLSDMLKQLKEKYEIRGGGNPHFVSLSTTYSEELMNEINDKLKKA